MFDQYDSMNIINALPKRCSFAEPDAHSNQTPSTKTLANQ